MWSILLKKSRFKRDGLKWLDRMYKAGKNTVKKKKSRIIYRELGTVYQHQLSGRMCSEGLEENENTKVNEWSAW